MLRSSFPNNFWTIKLQVFLFNLSVSVQILKNLGYWSLILSLVKCHSCNPALQLFQHCHTITNYTNNPPQKISSISKVVLLLRRCNEDTLLGLMTAELGLIQGIVLVITELLSATLVTSTWQSDKYFVQNMTDDWW